MVGQGKIEIVATEQKMLADGGSLKLQLAIDQTSAHQAEVGRPPADVADQNQFAIIEVIIVSTSCLWVSIRCDPRVKRG